MFEEKRDDLQRVVKEVSGFLSVGVVSLGIDLGMMMIVVGELNRNERLGKIVEKGVIVVVKYVGRKWVVFKKRKEEGV